MIFAGNDGVENVFLLLNWLKQNFVITRKILRLVTTAQLVND
jgi:hypothetical protein